MKKTSFQRLFLIIGLPVLFALVVRYLFGVETWENLYSVMSIAFLFGLPAGVGAITIYLSPIEKVKRGTYRFFMPWVPILCFFLLTLLLSIEGWACWIMILPVFLLLSSLGGIVAGLCKIRKHEKERMMVSLIALLPFFVAPLEQLIGTIPGQYKAYTCIDISATKENIWHNVTQVRAIRQKEGKGWLTEHLGFPQPVRAELDYEGVGGFRKAVFDKGLVFDETVTAYTPFHKMVFTIKANPYDIPSTTMDEHIVVGGKYFDVLNGTYELQSLNDSTFRLHLYSHFKLSTTFNFYASWWASWIMKDIQNNILQIVKQRAEMEGKYDPASYN
jgi:hypothetical protein